MEMQTKRLTVIFGLIASLIILFYLFFFSPFTSNISGKALFFQEEQAQIPDNFVIYEEVNGPVKIDSGFEDGPSPTIDITVGASCYDSDQGSNFIQGYTQEYDKNNKIIREENDYCKDSANLVEYDCGSGKITSKEVTCPYCHQGRCIAKGKTCKESNPFFTTPNTNSKFYPSVFIKGSINLDGENFEDVCVGSKVKDFGCGFHTFSMHECTFGCIDGKCRGNSSCTYTRDGAKDSKKSFKNYCSNDAKHAHRFICTEKGVGEIKEICDYRCFKGKCLTKQEINNDPSAPKCKKLVYSGDPEKRINIIFTGINAPSVARVKQDIHLMLDSAGKGMANPLNKHYPFYGFFGVDPYKSIGKDYFNIWYVDKIIENKNIPKSTTLEVKYRPPIFCDVPNRFSVGLYYKCPDCTSTSLDYVVADKDGNFTPSSLFLLAHEVGGHAIGQLGDEYHSAVSNYQFNTPSSMTTAQKRWGELIGNGCGKQGIVDCRKIHGKGLTNNLREVTFSVRDPSWCFDNQNLIEGCKVESYKFATKQPVSFWAGTKKDCQNFALDKNNHCMYKENGKVFCRTPQKVAECLSLLGSTQSYEFGVQPNRPDIVGSDIGIMESSESKSFSIHSSKGICKRIIKMTGRTPTYCSSKFCLNGCKNNEYCNKGKCFVKPKFALSSLKDICKEVILQKRQPPLSDVSRIETVNGAIFEPHCVDQNKKKVQKSNTIALPVCEYAQEPGGVTTASWLYDSWCNCEKGRCV